MIPLRRRVAAVVTCFTLAFAMFGYLQRDASEAVHEARNTVECEGVVETTQLLGCLTLYGD